MCEEILKLINSCLFLVLLLLGIYLFLVDIVTPDKSHVTCYKDQQENPENEVLSDIATGDVLIKNGFITYKRYEEKGIKMIINPEVYSFCKVEKTQ